MVIVMYHFTLSIYGWDDVTFQIYKFVKTYCWIGWHRGHLFYAKYQSFLILKVQILHRIVCLLVKLHVMNISVWWLELKYFEEKSFISHFYIESFYLLSYIFRSVRVFIESLFLCLLIVSMSNTCWWFYWACRFGLNSLSVHKNTIRYGEYGVVGVYGGCLAWISGNIMIFTAMPNSFYRIV